MCELSSNVARARDFLKVFDCYLIGSNYLTQLVVGLDRDSCTVAHLFDDRDDVVRDTIATVIHSAKAAVGKPISICHQAPSDYPDFSRWLVYQGINSIPLTPDAVIKTHFVIAKAA